MKTSTLGTGGPTVTRLGFGGMPLSIQLDGFPRPDEATALQVVHAVLDAGVTLLDTADVYCADDSESGHNERLFAKALKTWSGNRDTITVATKGGLVHPERLVWDADGRPEHLIEACERSLRNLEVDCIDLYQLHVPDPKVPWEDSVGAVARLREQGKVRWVGLSNVSVDHVERARAIVPVQTVQNMLSVFERAPLKRGGFFKPCLLEYCRRRGIGFLAYSPLGGAARNTELTKHPVVTEIAAHHRVSPHAVAIAWLLELDDHVVPIPAARSVKNALDSVSAAKLHLSTAECNKIRRASFG